MKNGGKVIGSGGFGCIFRPQIKCNGSNQIYGDNKYDPNGISKVMIKKYGKQEYRELTKFMPIIKTIPNYDRYFMMSQITACHPEPFTEEDLINFDIKKCSGLKKRGFQKENINSFLDDLYTINMPYGGDDVDVFIKKNINNIKVVKLFNIKMIELLKKAIIPMNDRGIYHGDLKSANILVEKTKTTIYTRIIDWGLSGIYLPDKMLLSNLFLDDWEKIPDIFRNRPFQYNVPFSNILFSNAFHKYYDKFLLDNNGDLKHLRRFIKQFTDYYIESKSGHLRIFDSVFDNKNPIINTQYEKNNIINVITYTLSIDKDTMYVGNNELNITHMDYIYEYIYKILIKYTSDNYFNVIGYFEEVYIHNLDIWGFIMGYEPLILNPITNNKYKKDIKDVFSVLLTLLLEFSDNRIPIELLENTLTIFNNKLSKLQKKKTKKNK
jgi:hypothetical protein